MDGQAIATVSVAVVTLVQLVRWGGVPDRFGPLAVLVCSVIGVGFWGWGEGTFERTVAFDYFTGFLLVMTSAAGVFGFTRPVGDAMVKLTNRAKDDSISPASLRVIKRREDDDDGA